MHLARFTLAVVLVAATATAFGATFIVPTDEEMVAKSAAIVTGTVEGSYVQRGESTIETVYEIRVDRALKGAAASRGELLRIVSPGGVIGDEGVLVPGAAHFLNGDRVLLFLTHENGKWETTDLTLGKFRFLTSTAGEPLLVRDAEDIHGWDENGQVHREPVRRESGFLRFIEQRVGGGRPQADYTVDAAAVSLPSDTSATDQRFAGVTANATYAPKTYTDNVSDGTTYRGIRWSNMSAGVVFYKRADQNISGASDGGVSVIQNGLAAWNNECGSVINLQYGGTTTTVSKNFDTTHVVEFNDPQSRISGSWTGSGTIATTFLSFGSSHSFANDTWWTMTDADVVFQNGYAATNASFAPAMTHELGHGIGWRHSNAHYIRNADYTDGTCNSTVEECTSAAIMNAVVNSAYGYTLQPWDVHAAQAVYPGGTCSTCTPPSITGQPSSSTINSGSSVTLSVTATGTAPSYQWYIGTSGNTANPIAGATSSTLKVTPTSTTSYWVRVSNACGTVNSATATITVNSTTTPPPGGHDPQSDFDGDGKSEILWKNISTGQIAYWDLSGRTLANGAAFATLANQDWRVQGSGDFNADGTDDIVWRNRSTGVTAMWEMHGRSVSNAAQFATTTPLSWAIEAFGDFTGDGKDEIIWRNPSTGELAMWELNGHTLINTAVFATTPNTNWRVELAADFTGDGKDELILRNMSTGAIAMWELNGRTVTNSGTIATFANFDYQIAGAGDFNGDGKADLLWRNQANGWFAMWEMNGRTITNSNAIRQVSLDWEISAVGDYDGDGKDEIIWWNRTTGDVAMWEMNGHTVLNSGTFIRIGDLNWHIEPRGSRPSLTTQ